MKKNLKICFPGWNLTRYLPGSEDDNLYTFLLGRYYNVIIDPVNPDVIFYDLLEPSILETVKNYNCLKIYVINEPNPYHPDDIKIYQPATTWIGGIKNYEALKYADYIISSFKIDSPKNYYIPLFLFWLYHQVFVSKITSFEKLINYKSFTKDDIKNRKFFIYLHSNTGPPRRKMIFNQLKDYKQIDTRPDVRNFLSDDFLSIDKIKLLKNYKFSCAMQNHSIADSKDVVSSRYLSLSSYDKQWLKDQGEKYYPGFIDEKIMDSYIANTIPIYYGNDMVTDYFNEKSFLNWHSFDSDEAFVDKIIELDQNDDIYLEYLNQPTFLSLDLLKLDEIAEYLKKIIN